MNSYSNNICSNLNNETALFRSGCKKCEILCIYSYLVLSDTYTQEKQD